MIRNTGLRHLAIRVGNVERSAQFYARVFGMKIVWQPDRDNAYLSSGCDSLALHRAEVVNPAADPNAQPLDHLGFIVRTVADLEAGYAWATGNGIEMVHPLRRHRDGSVSFYIRDPDGNIVQLLYEPSISRLAIEQSRAQESEEKP